MFNEFYQEELRFLKELGREFAQGNPTVAHMLDGPGRDPDVERLLEGVAFLTGRIREKLDDEFPELIHGLMNLFFPHYLRPIPAMTMIRFDPKPETLRSKVIIPAGTILDSTPVDGVACRFRTVSPVHIYPLTLTAVALETPLSGTPCLEMRLSLPKGLNIRQTGLDRLRLYLSGEGQEGYDLYYLLTHMVKRWSIRTDHAAVNLPLDHIQAAGFQADQAMWPYPAGAFPGYRLLQEYFCLPEKFKQVELLGLDRAADLPVDGGIIISFELTGLPRSKPRVGLSNVLLFTTPAVNLFAHEADPIRVDQQHFEYPIRPTGLNPAHFVIQSIDRVVGYLPGTAEELEYPSFFSFRRRADFVRGERIYYHPRLKSPLIGDAPNMTMAFINVNQRGVIPSTEIISMDLTCSNGRLPEKLRPGDLDAATAGMAGVAGVSLVSRISRFVPPPLGSDLHWLLVSHWSQNYQALNSVESLRQILSLYNFPALIDRQAAQEHELRLGALTDLITRPEEQLYRGRPVRGLSVDLTVNESKFSSQGELFLFSKVLSEFLTQYATINAFVRLTVKGTALGEVYSFPARLGEKTLL
ncbi:MAG: type VI secretion system baseplate subunit TssF [Deltaproteobacteria bacterium]|nr:type VI secretion system baseplate subunit TssF [Deltaproteobacteria bacterium]